MSGRRTRQGGNRADRPPAGGLASVGPVGMTPPCSDCGYPLLKSDKVCPRCKQDTPWKHRADRIGP